MKKKLLALLLTLVLCFSITACGSSGSTETESDADAVVTQEQYDALSADSWNSMTLEEMEEYLGVKSVEDEESTAEWGDGYLVVDFPGEDGHYLHVLFKDKDGDGNMTPSSISW